MKSKGERAFERVVRQKSFPQTDSGNAELFVSLYGKRFRYVKGWGRWIVWTGTHWAEDVGGIRMARLAKKAIRKIRNIKWRKASESRRRREATIALAIAEPDVAIEHTDLDKSPWLLNVQNGTLDLRTGKLKRHRRADMITKMTPCVYNPHEECTEWTHFVDTAMGGDKTLVDYLQRFVGYSLTGITREQALIFHYGGGNNGKSTFIKTLQRMLGSYATRAARGLLFRSRHERHPTSLANLNNRRFVSCSEIDEEQEWDEGLVKDLTGEDPINARYMRQDEWVFIPIHKLWLAGNEKPRTKGTNLGIWRRIQLVPWEVVVAAKDIDGKLGDKLWMEAPGILNWAIAGCLAWRKQGLQPPARVLAATAEYRKEQDTVGQFFAEALVFDTKAKIGRAELRTQYETWCEDLGYLPVGARRFTQALRRHNVVEGGVWDKEKGQPARGWHGVRAISVGEHAQKELDVNRERFTEHERGRLRRVVEREKAKTAPAKPTEPGGNVYTMRPKKRSTQSLHDPK